MHTPHTTQHTTSFPKGTLRPSVVVFNNISFVPLPSPSSSVHSPRLETRTCSTQSKKCTSERFQRKTLLFYDPQPATGWSKNSTNFPRNSTQIKTKSTAFLNRKLGISELSTHFFSARCSRRISAFRCFCFRICCSPFLLHRRPLAAPK